MKLPDQCAMPMVEVVDGFQNDETPVIATFYGPHAYTNATAFIPMLPEFVSGRWGLDICDVQCTCGHVFWHEAWDDGEARGFHEPSKKWLCPHCARGFTEAEADEMQTPIPELES